MGMIIEFNWFMVVANENKILEEQENLFYAIKSEKTHLSNRFPNSINR